MTETVTWRARLRFRLQKKIRIDGKEHRLQIAGREVVLTPPTPDLKIMDSEWLIMNARGFASEDEARQFGHRLKIAVEVSAVAARVGVDTGRNVATSGLGKMVKDALAQEGAHVRDNIHGLDVFPDHPNTQICIPPAGSARPPAPEEAVGPSLRGAKYARARTCPEARRGLRGSRAPHRESLWPDSAQSGRRRNSASRPSRCEDVCGLNRAASATWSA